MKSLTFLYFRIVGMLMLTGVIFGIISPFLISAQNTVYTLLGIILIPCQIWFVVMWIRHEMKKHEEAEEKKWEAKRR